MKIIATLTAEDFKMAPYSHLVRCLYPGCAMAADPRQAIDEQDARAWAKAHLNNQRSHTVRIEEVGS